MRILAARGTDDARPAFAEREQRYRALMVRYQAGDAGAFTSLYAQLAPELRSYLAELGPETRGDATIVDEVFIVMHETRRSYNPRRPFAAWVAAIAQHVRHHRLSAQALP